MHNGTIHFNGVDFSTLGKPSLKISRVPDPPAPAQATRSLVTLTVRILLEALSPDTIAARASRISKALQYGEGILQFDTGAGRAEAWLASPGQHGLDAALIGKTNAIEINFTAVEPFSNAAIQGLTKASYQAFGATTAITLLAIRENQKEVKTDYHGERNNARKVTTTTVSLTARVMMANPADPISNRLAALKAKEAEIEEALRSKEGTLTIGGVAKVVRIQSFTPIIDEAAQTLDVKIQTSHYTLPDSSVAEVSLKTNSRTDEGMGEESVTTSGTIEAQTRSIALAKLDNIRSAESAIIGSRITSITVEHARIEGNDTLSIAGADWTGALSFSIERKQALSGSHFNLKVTTSRDIRNGMRWNYSGTVKAVDAETALTRARAIGGSAAHPVRVKDEETVETTTEAINISTPNAKFVQVNFTYEYEGPSDGFITAEISMDAGRPRYGEWTTAISGYVVAANRASAEARLELLLAGEGTNLEKSTKWTTLILDKTGTDATPNTLYQKLDFTFTRRDGRSYASAKYTDTESSDAGTMTLSRSISGTLWSNTAANANTALTSLLATVFGGSPPQKINKSTPIEISASDGIMNNAGSVSTFWQIDFSAERTSAATGLDGHDIIEASYTMQRKGSINVPIITAIPFARPVAQINTGYIPGSITIQARCKSRVQGTGKAWCQGMRALATSIGTANVTQHETQQPDESSTPEYAPFNGTTITLWNFSASYGWTYTGNVLDGLW